MQQIAIDILTASCNILSTITQLETRKQLIERREQPNKVLIENFQIMIDNLESVRRAYHRIELERKVQRMKIHAQTKRELAMELEIKQLTEVNERLKEGL